MLQPPTQIKGQKASVLHALHVFTGCYQTSAFLGQGKTSAWATWMTCNQETIAFSALSQTPTQEDVLTVMPVLESFVILMYDRSSSCQNVKEAHKVLFSQKGRSLESIPPTADPYSIIHKEPPIKLDISGVSA